MQPGDEIFIPTLVLDSSLNNDAVHISGNGIIKDDDPDQMIYRTPQILKGTIIKELSGDNFEVEIASLQGKQIEVLPRQNIIKSRDEAEKKLCSVIALGERNQLKELVKGNTDFLPNYIADKWVHYSANPLRYGEPSIAFYAQSNTWSASENVQKILQTIGTIWQDIYRSKLPYLCWGTRTIIQRN
jgi:hypothetical protein